MQGYPWSSPFPTNALGDLNSIVQALNQPARNLQELPRRLELCRLALTLVSQSQQCGTLGALADQNGKYLSVILEGNTADNWEKAIHRYKQVLEVYTRSVFPEQWAQTENNLAIAYSMPSAERTR